VERRRHDRHEPPPGRRRGAHRDRVDVEVSGHAVPVDHGRGRPAEF